MCTRSTTLRGLGKWVGLHWGVVLGDTILYLYFYNGLQGEYLLC